MPEFQTQTSEWWILIADLNVAPSQRKTTQVRQAEVVAVKCIESDVAHGYLLVELHLRSGQAFRGWVQKYLVETE